ncbi:MAG: CHASE2 domain-containing protein [Roseobacter sp.]|jgi:adenylate cyclase
MNTLLPLWQRIAIAFFVGLISGLSVFALRAAGALQAWELSQYDLVTTLLAENSLVPDVVLLALTDADLARWGWPVPDGEIASITTAALKGGAGAVGLDIYRDVPVGAGRAALLEILADPRVVTISRLPSAEAVGIEAPDGLKTGFSDIPIDPDGVARRALLLVNTNEGIALSFPMQLAMTFMGQGGLQTSPQDPHVLALGAMAVPPLPAVFGPYRRLDNAGYQIMTRHVNALPIAAHISPDDLLSGSADVAGKVVMIALTSHAVKDYFSTPLNRRTGADFAFGGEVHAAITQQLIGHMSEELAPLRAMGSMPALALGLAAAFAGALLASFMPVTFLSIVLGIVVAVLLVLSLSALQTMSVLAPVVPVTLAWSVAFTVAFAIVASIAWNQRRVMAGIFTSQMSDALSADIWRQRRRLIDGRKPVSRRLFVTVLLADIEGSTRVGKGMEAQDFMEWISTILDELARIAQEHGGFVEKYTGDGILIVFGAPIPKETQAERREDAKAAVGCAQAMQRATDALNKTNSQTPYKLRIGINSGEVVGGTLGTSGAMRYNIIGDTVNVAARVEAYSKSLAPDAKGHRPVCVTGATADLVGVDRFVALEDSLMHDDGETPIRIYILK